MKLEQINENQICCTLSEQDLADRHLQPGELAYGNDKTKQLFRGMLQMAACEFNFHTDELPLVIEAVPMRDHSILLTITKVEYPEELDTRFSNFTDSDEYPLQQDDDDSPTLEGADSIRSLLERLGTTAAAELVKKASASLPRKDSSSAPSKDTAENAPADGTPDAPDIEAPADLVRLFSVRQLPHLVRIAHVLKGFYTEDNSLFLDPQEHVYYLLLHKGHHTPAEFNKVCNTLSEYAFQNRYTDSAAAFFQEHFQCVASHDALQRLAQI